MVAADALHGMQFGVDLVAGPKFGDEDVVVHRTNRFGRVDLLLLAQRHPLQVRRQHCAQTFLVFIYSYLYWFRRVWSW